MTAETTGAAPSQAGRTVIRTQAIRRLVEAITADAAGVTAGRVSAALGDERGALVVRVATPIELQAETTDVTLVDRARELATAVATGLDDLAGRTVGQVDVRITGAQRSDRRRVL